MKSITFKDFLKLSRMLESSLAISLLDFSILNPLFTNSIRPVKGAPITSRDADKAFTTPPRAFLIPLVPSPEIQSPHPRVASPNQLEASIAPTGARNFDTAPPIAFAVTPPDTMAISAAASPPSMIASA